MITVMILAYNEREMVEAAVKSFRLFAEIETSLIIIDNCSTDGLKEWAKRQVDLAYVSLDIDSIGWGKAINMVKRELHINTDLLVMEGHFLLTPQCLPRLVKLLHEEEDIGGVCGMFNEKNGYEKAIEMANENGDGKRKRAMALYHGAILWRKEALEEIGDFEEHMATLSLIAEDYCLRMTKADRMLLICSNAFFWHGGNRNTINNEMQWEREILKKKWGMKYFNSVCNGKLVALVEGGEDDEITVLEIGCDCGATLLEIKNRYPKAKVFGTEINKQSASFAEHFAQITINNIEDENLPFDKGTFDYIIFGDVLEHLHNPLETIKYCKDYLRQDGCIIASIPNIMHISVIANLLKGNFTYTEVGLLDKTHIHFFTCNEIIRLFDEAGFEICNLGSTVYEVSDEQNQVIDKLLSIDSSADRFMYETFQYIVKARNRI